MPRTSEPSCPSDAYKAIIDQLVNETRHYGTAARVSQKGIFSNAPAHGAFNEFIASLSADQRELLSRMLQEERDSAIHDVLAQLTWWIITRGVGLIFKGQPMPVDLSGMGLHGDFVGRRDGWEWPDGSDGTTP